MIKNFTFKTNNTNNNCPFPKSTDYSKILDNIISSNIKKTNTYLIYEDLKNFFNINDNKFDIGSSLPKIDNKFIKAATYLANYKKSLNKIPFKFGKVYKLADGTPIVFYDDEIQIGFDLYKYSDFTNFDFINNLTEDAKKTIIEIYTSGYKIEIKL